MPARKLAASRILPALLVVLPLVIAAWILGLEHRIAEDWGFALDDSWIHATIARNVATGNGFSFNPGEPVAGSTGPLYTLVLALLYLLTRESIWTAKIFGIACHIGTALLAWRAMRRLLPGSTVPAALTSLLVATSPGLLWAALSGMEIPLFLLLVMAGACAWLEGKDRLAAFFWALGVWVRPDGLFLLALFLILDPRRALRRFAVMAPVLLLFVGFNYATGGAPFPQTVGAKAHFGIDLVGRTLNLLLEWAALWGIPYHGPEHPLVLLPLLLAGAVFAARRWPIATLYVIGLPIAFSLFNDQSGPRKRYLLPVVPFGMMLVGLGASQVAGWLKRVPSRQVLVAISATALLWQVALLPTMRENYAWNVQNINKMHCLLARFAKATTSPQAAIATNDIGAFGYFSGRYVVDLMGLVTPLRPFPEQLRRYRPEMVFLFLPWFEDYLEPDPLSQNYRFWDADSTHRYELIAGIELTHNTVAANNRMTAYVRLSKDQPSPERRFLYRF